MNTVIGIIIVCLILAFPQRLMTGIAGGIVCGLIGLLFGGSGGKIGFIIGFLIGVAGENETKDKTGEHTDSKEGSSKARKENSDTNRKSKLFRCPSCKTKINVKLPLKANKGTCPACGTRFGIAIDEHGNVKVDAGKSDTKYGTRGQSTVSEYFKILGVDASATPEEVRAAYKRKIREYHPDRASGLGEKIIDLAAEESKVINAAYSALKSKGLAS